MNKFSLVVAVVLICGVWGCSPTIPSKDMINTSIKKIMPQNFEIVSVTSLKEIPALIEVTLKMDKQPVVLYMDSKAQYVISGSLLDLKTKKNLTVEAQSKIK